MPAFELHSCTRRRPHHVSLQPSFFPLFGTSPFAVCLGTLSGRPNTANTGPAHRHSAAQNIHPQNPTGPPRSRPSLPFRGRHFCLSPFLSQVHPHLPGLSKQGSLKRHFDSIISKRKHSPILVVFGDGRCSRQIKPSNPPARFSPLNPPVLVAVLGGLPQIGPGEKSTSAANL